MTIPLIVVGAGGFGREVLDVIRAVNYTSESDVFELLGVVDANPSTPNLERLAVQGVKWLGTPSVWLQSGSHAHYVIGIGKPSIRERISREFSAAGLSAATVIHPAATIGSAVTVGEGSVICGGVQISTNVTIGRHVHVNPNATIGHDTVLDDFVSINPAATVSGDVSVGAASLIGAAAVVLQGLSVGLGAVVGAGSCVTRDVDDERTVMGVPAR